MPDQNPRHNLEFGYPSDRSGRPIEIVFARGGGGGGGTLNIYWWGCAAAHPKRGVLGTGTAPKKGGGS